jgi:DNA polymerase I-like protein with 3'-5' exonuclease and polymerase domains
LKTAKEVQEIYDRLMPEVAELQARASHLAKSKCDEDCRKGGRHAKLLARLHREYEHRGYIRTVAGRRSRFPSNWKTFRALNRVIQGSAADVMKQKLVELHRERKRTGFLMRMTVHDEVGGDAQTPETATMVSEILNQQSFPELKVPIRWSVKTGANWAEAK